VAQQAREAMDIDNGSALFSALLQGDNAHSVGHVDNFEHNHFSVAPFWYTDFNQSVKLDFRHASLKEITTSMSKSLGQALLKQNLTQNGQGSAIA
jgi:hypothetical protein